MLNGLEYSKDPNNFYVKVNSPRRKYHDFKTECYNDAIEIKKLGPVYVLFSTGIDSQIIARSLTDANVDAEYIFLNYKNYSVELDRVKECEKFYKISIRIIDLNIEEYKEEWINKAANEPIPSLRHYPFEWLSENLKENFPIITQGSNDPAIVGLSKNKMSIYCNYYEGMEQRFRLMKKYRNVYDFPFSPEAIASLYTNDELKTFCNTIQYFKENSLEKNKNTLKNSQYFNYFAKPFVKGKSFADSIIWHGKLTGYEQCPDWLTDHKYSIFDVLETRISIPIWDLIDFLEQTQNTHKLYSDWHFKGHFPEFTSIKSLCMQEKPI